MLRAQRRDPAKAQAKCAFATNYPLANRQLRSPLILRYRMQRDKPFLVLGAVGALSLFLGSLVMYLYVVDGVLKNCSVDIFCFPNQVLFWTAGMFVSVGLLATVAKMKLA